MLQVISDLKDRGGGDPYLARRGGSLVVLADYFADGFAFAACNARFHDPRNNCSDPHNLNGRQS